MSNINPLLFSFLKTRGCIPQKSVRAVSQETRVATAKRSTISFPWCDWHFWSTVPLPLDDQNMIKYMVTVSNSYCLLSIWWSLLVEMKKRSGRRCSTLCLKCSKTFCLLREPHLLQLRCYCADFHSGVWNWSKIYSHYGRLSVTSRLLLVASHCNKMSDSSQVWKTQYILGFFIWLPNCMVLISPTRTITCNLEF